MSETHERALAWLFGARVERIDGPTPGLFSITLYQPQHKHSLVLAVGALRGVGSTLERPKGDAASAFVRRLRVKLENARLVDARWLGGTDPARATALLLAFQRKDGEERILADFDASSPNLYLLSEDGRVGGAADERAAKRRIPDRSLPYTPPSGRGIERVADAEALLAAGEHLLGGSVERGIAALRAEALSAARARLKKAERKAAAIRGDLERAAAAPQLRREANVLLCHLHEIPRGKAQVDLLDEASDPPELLRITLDPAHDARTNADKRFERAKKLERGASISAARLAEVERDLDGLRGLLSALATEDPALLPAQARELGISPDPKFVGERRRQGRAEHVPFRAFLSNTGHKILVGKSAADNDTLTLTVARPHDHWLHARGTHGSHVVIPLDKNSELPDSLLIDAAHLAAHFSDVRGEPSAEIQHTQRRYVRKPKGAAKGAVLVDREKVLLLRVENDRLAKLLASEIRAK